MCKGTNKRAKYKVYFGISQRARVPSRYKVLKGTNKRAKKQVENTIGAPKRALTCFEAPIKYLQ